MNTPARGLLVAATFVVAQLAWAADESAKPGDKSDEVVIEATRANLAKLGNQVKMAEFRFYKRYNDLNKKREYAINCNKEATIGSRFTSDVCMPLYATRALEAEAQAFIQMIGAGSSDSGAPRSARQMMSAPPGGQGVSAGGGMPAKIAIEAGRSAFQKNVIEVTNNNPDLQKLLGEHARLWKQWENLYYRVNGRELGQTRETSDEEYNYDRNPATDKK